MIVGVRVPLAGVKGTPTNSKPASGMVLFWASPVSRNKRTARNPAISTAQHSL